MPWEEGYASLRGRITPAGWQASERVRSAEYEEFDWPEGDCWMYTKKIRDQVLSKVTSFSLQMVALESLMRLQSGGVNEGFLLTIAERRCDLMRAIGNRLLKVKENEDCPKECLEYETVPGYKFKKL